MLQRMLHEQQASQEDARTLIDSFVLSQNQAIPAFTVHSTSYDSKIYLENLLLNNYWSFYEYKKGFRWKESDEKIRFCFALPAYRGTRATMISMISGIGRE